MSKATLIEVSKLSLDLRNFRTTPQKTEADAIHAMISIKPDRFFAVMESLIDDGYLSTETIIVLKVDEKLVVREGNRRIAIMKLIHGLHDADDFQIPNNLKLRIKSIPLEWKKENIKVPCAVYEPKESDIVEKIVRLTHGKGEKAGRDPWNSVARARYNRDTVGASEPALDLLENFISVAKNLTDQQKERWGGDFPLTVLNEAVNKIYPRFDVKSVIELSNQYPKINFRTELEDMIRDIGLFQLETRDTRDGKEFASKYGILPIAPTAPTSTTKKTTSSTPTVPLNQVGGANRSSSLAPTTLSPAVPLIVAPAPVGSSTSATGPYSVKAHSLNDPKSVIAFLKAFTPKGANRQKVVSLRDEMKSLNLEKNPIAFCLLLRSIFEISAKIYCSEQSISVTKQNNKGVQVERTLSELLTEAIKKLTTGNAQVDKILHGAKSELTTPGRILSITSMNQLVHNPTFSITSSDICVLFNNIAPLLEFMN